MENRDLNTLKDCVERWAKEKGIWGGVDFLTQFNKFREEVDELSDELVVLEPVNGKHYDPKRIVGLDEVDHDAVKNELGDVVVTLIILASRLDTTVEECLGKAYDKIAKRTGRVINGTFVKSEDLL